MRAAAAAVARAGLPSEAAALLRNAGLRGPAAPPGACADGFLTTVDAFSAAGRRAGALLAGTAGRGAAGAGARSAGALPRPCAGPPARGFAAGAPPGGSLPPRGPARAAARLAAVEAAASGAAFGPSLASAAASAPRSWAGSIGHYALLYAQLSKARLSALVVSTAVAGYVLGSGETIDYAGMAWMSLGTAGAAASANAFNQIREIALDSRMARTLRRPLPSGRLSPAHAVAFASLMGAGGCGVLFFAGNPLTAALGAANIVLYAAVYTPLKQISLINTWVGAVVGAVPPLMGWAAAAGGLQLGAGVMAAGLYFWQLPHFMALAWMCKADYAAGGYRMLSIFDATGHRTAACALRNSLYMLPLGLVAAHLGVTSYDFAAQAAVLAAGLAAASAYFYASPSIASAKMLFRASLLHLPLLMGAAMWDRRPNPAAAPLGAAAAAAAPLAALAGAAAPYGAGGGFADRGGAYYGWSGGQTTISMVPFPFLPVPSVGISCPSRLEAEEAAEGAAAKGGSGLPGAAPAGLEGTPAAGAGARKVPRP